MATTHGIERALLRLLQAIDEIVRDRRRPERKLEVNLPRLMARALAAGGHTCHEAVAVAARDYIDAWLTEQMVDDLTSLLAIDVPSADWEPLVGNLRIRTRQLRKRRQQLLNDLRVEVRTVSPGNSFDPNYHRPQPEPVPGTAPEDEGKVALMHAPAFVWREDGREQVIPAEVTLFGTPTPEAHNETTATLPIDSRSRTRKRKRRSRQPSA